MDCWTAFNWTRHDVRVGVWDVIVNRVAASSLMPRIGRFAIYRAVGLPVRSAAMSPGIYFQSSRTTIGRRTFVNRGARFYAGGSSIEIGDFVQVAMGATFLGETHPIGGPEERCHYTVLARPVRVGNGCWVGANATVLPGVTIAPGCVIAAGAVVTHDCDANGLYAGVPARRVKDL